MARARSLAPFAAVLAFLAPVALGAPVAFVADVRGEARAANGAKLGMLAALEPSTPVTLGKDASAALIYIATGTEFQLKGPGEFVVDAAEVKVLRGNPPSRRVSASAPNPALVRRNAEAVTASVRMRSFAMPEPPGSALLYPQAGATIATLQPTFMWDAKGGATDFTVVVLDADGKQAWRGTAAGRSLKLPVKLVPGARYRWTLSSGSALGEAAFETLPAEALRRAEGSRARAKTFPDRVLHAFVLQDVGANQDARFAWAALARERPDLPELALLAR